jgi:hypothetical protein
MSGRNDHDDSYNSRRYSSQSHMNPLYHRPTSHHFGTGPPPPVATQGERYGKDDQIPAYHTRSRYNDAARASWHGGATPHEISAPQYISASLPTQSHLHHSHHLNTQSQYSLHPHSSRALSPTHMSPSRLPPDSTLLTPLPGYQSSSLLPPLQVGGELGYSSSNYGVYDDESHPRPSTGHASIGYGSADEY